MNMNTERPNESQKKYGINQEILKDFIGIDTGNIRTIEYAQQCLAIYEETLRAMGLLAGEEISEAVDNSQLSYAEAEVREEEYANFPECY